jgi:hypothetical protein
VSITGGTPDAGVNNGIAVLTGCSELSEVEISSVMENL